VGQVKNAVARATIRGEKQPGYIQRLAGTPRIEARGCQDIVDL